MTRLLVVTLLLAAVAIVLKLRSRNTTTTRAIKVTSRLTINRGSMIAVVEIDGRRLLIGAAANQVNLLAELADTEPDVSDPLAPNPTAGPGLVTRSTSPRAVPGRRTGTQIGSQTSLVERARRMTTRTAEPRLRLPNQFGSES